MSEGKVSEEKGSHKLLKLSDCSSWGMDALVPLVDSDRIAKVFTTNSLKTSLILAFFYT